MQLLVIAILIGIGTARVVETLKEVAPLLAPPWVKSTLSIGLCIGAAYLLGEDLLLVGVGGAGVAMLTHEVRSALYLYGDRNKQIIIQSASQRVRR